MSGTFLDNSFFRNIYCYLAGGSTECAERGYSGFLPSGLEWLAFLIAAFVVGFVLINVILTAILVLIWTERRLLGRFQQRTGPNRWGPFGLLTPIADAIKIMFKEDILPSEADKPLYLIAPVLVMVPTLLVWSVIPIGPGIFVSNINVGVLFVLGITGITALATVMAGWASANRISIFSVTRAVALLISYEIPASLALVGVVMLTGSLSLAEIVSAQNVPFIIVQPLGFLVFFIASLAELNRSPFDLSEAESELAAGHLNDYSSMKFGLLFVAEYAAAFASAAFIATLFLSGWRGWFVLPAPLWFLLKTGIVWFAIIWIRASWPRLRIDQMLNLAWKGLFELTLVNIVITAALLAIFQQPSTSELWIIAAINWVFFFPAVWFIGKLLFKRAPLPDDSTLTPYPVAPADRGSF